MTIFVSCLLVLHQVVYTSNIKDKSLITRVVLNQTGSIRQRYIWDKQAESWTPYSNVPKDYCDIYNTCGPNGQCIVNEAPRCKCLTGFKPKLPQKYNALDWTQGCVHSEPWQCRVKDKDGFKRFSGLKIPDTRTAWANASMTLLECKAKCWDNCSCKAYANLYITGGGSGCILWFGDLIDMRVTTVPGQDLFIRMAYSDTGMNFNLLLGALLLHFSVY